MRRRTALKRRASLRPCQPFEPGPCCRFTQKEIFEQPRAVANTLEGITGFDPALFGENAAAVLAEVDSALILACGNGRYSSLVAKPSSLTPAA